MKLAIAFILASTLFGNAQDKNYTFVFLNKNPNKKELPKEEVDKIMEGHMANIRRLASEGKLLVAGPFEGGGGIFIFKSSSVAETKSWLQTDPGVLAERWLLEVLPYHIRHGSLCAAAEPIVMGMHPFIRYTKTTSPVSAATSRSHMDYLDSLARKDMMLMDGTFDDGGEIIVLKGELNKKQLEEDPAVIAKALVPDFRSLYIAKGAFCE